MLGIVLAGGGASPATARSCHASAHSAAQALPPITVTHVEAMSCRQGVRVMRRVAPALGANYFDRLARTRNRLIAGYRCSGYLIGDASWRITCHRGGHVVTGFTAE